jgi:hypothetical protein
MECNLAKTAIFRELVFQENLMVVAWFLTTFPSTKSNQRPAMDPWCVAPKKLRGGHISTAMLRFFASGLSWIKTLAHDGDNDDGEKWRKPKMEDNYSTIW